MYSTFDLTWKSIECFKFSIKTPLIFFFVHNEIYFCFSVACNSILVAVHVCMCEPDHLRHNESSVQASVQDSTAVRHSPYLIHDPRRIEPWRSVQHQGLNQTSVSVYLHLLPSFNNNYNEFNLKQIILIH